MPVVWPVVQATAWRSGKGDVCYALANMSAEPQAITLHLAPHGMEGAAVQLTRISADGQQPLLKDVHLPYRIPVQLKAWEICCVEQKP